MIKQVNHPAQVSILRKLLYNTAARFTKLQKSTGLSSDHFNFHVRKLVRVGLISKQAEGEYVLTAEGKEYANTLDGASESGRQPKVSMLLIVRRGEGDKREYLVQRRLKHPHYGFYGRLSGKVQWGESFSDAAKRVLKIETNLDADFDFKMVFRKYDLEDKVHSLLEDKIFIVMETSRVRGELLEQTRRGQNLWMSRKDFLHLDPKICFKSARDFMIASDSDLKYFEQSYTYSSDEY
jgi:ADP-ribose pyrophosphatase YjhB (NUDIX family)/predicted transcriptional regulator